MIKENTKKGCFDFIATTPNEYSEYDISPYFKVTKVIRRLGLTGQADVIELAVNDHNERQYTVEFEMSGIYDSRTFLSYLAGRGIVVSPYYGQLFVRYLFDEYRRVAKSNVEYRHNELGITENNGKRIFLYDKTKVGKFESVYERDFKFTSGSKEEYTRFLQDTVFPCEKLSLAYSIGFSSSVIARLKGVYDVGNIVVNFCGASSTGKTTAENLLVSSFGCPQETNQYGLVHTFHATQNALFASLEGIHGLPMVLDDITSNPNSNTTNLLYSLVAGNGKARCEQSGELKDVNSAWEGVIVISSETPILDDLPQNQGLKARVISTENIVWTPDAKTAEKVKNVVLKNYGFYGKEFAEYLIDISDEELLSRFEKARKCVAEVMKIRDNLSDRLEAKYAVFYLTVELLNEFFKISLSADSLISILLEPEQRNIEERDISIRGLNVITDFIITKRQHFIEFDSLQKNGQFKMASGDNFGTIKVTGRVWEVYIPVEKVKEILKANGINEISTVRKKWQEKGITKCDNKRTDIKFLQRRQICFVFKNGFNDDAIDQPPIQKGTLASQNDQAVKQDNTVWNDETTLDEIFEASNV